MSAHTLDEPDGHEPDPEALAGAARAYQQAYRLWQSAPAGPQQEALREHVRQAVYDLWPLLGAVLLPVAHRWARSHQLALPSADSWRAAVDETLTSLCLEILDVLPRLELRPGESPAGLLRTIARRREIDSYRRLTRDERPPAQPERAASPDNDRPPRRRQVSLDEGLLEDCADTLGQSLESQVIEHEYRRQVRDLTLSYWRSHLSVQEALIIRERLLRDPPSRHDHIAEMLGEPWTSELVRTRLHRLLKRTREHLRSCGISVTEM